jgi:hypothetical protein
MQQLKNAFIFILISVLILPVFNCGNKEEIIPYQKPNPTNAPSISALNLFTGDENTFCEGKSFALIVGNGTSSALDNFEVRWELMPNVGSIGPAYNLQVPYQTEFDTIVATAYYASADSSNFGTVEKIVVKSSIGCDLEGF